MSGWSSRSTGLTHTSEITDNTCFNQFAKKIKFCLYFKNLKKKKGKKKVKSGGKKKVGEKIIQKVEKKLGINKHKWMNSKK